jgi:7-cyano-7-deazaguanine synthase
MSKVAVLLSGGLDSIVLAMMASKAGILAGGVFINYGQPALEQERQAASRWASLHNERLEILKVGLSAESLAAGVGAPGLRIVPSRNIVLVSLAAHAAARLNASEVWYGATAEDQGYPDCRPEFVSALSAALALDLPGVSVRIPLSGMNRREVRALADALEVNTREVWSCYQPTAEGKPCGSCNSCRQDSVCGVL